MRVLVTGGSRGIGKEIVELFLNNGHDVWSPCREELDLSSEKIILTDVDFDVVVNNAGINLLQPVTGIEDCITMRVNYFSPLQIVQQIIPGMIKRMYGRIINVGSIWVEQSKSKRHAYSASKSALNSLTKSIASEYSQYNILANTVSPGFIETDLTRANNTKEEIDLIKKTIPSNRLGLPEEIANLIYFLTISNTYITGQNIIIDGGFSCSRN